MRDRKGQKRKVWKGILTVCMIVLLTAFYLPGKVRALNVDLNSVGVVGLLDEEGNALAGVSAFGMSGDPRGVISQYVGGTQFAYAVYINENGSYNLEYSASNEAMGISIWNVVEGGEGDSGFLIPNYAYEGESVAAVLLYRENGEINKAYYEMTLTGWKQNQLITDSYPVGDILYPAPIVDQNGQLVGLFVKEGVAWDPFGSEETFYGSGSSGGSDNPGGSGGSGGSDNPGSSGGSDSSRNTAPALRGIFSSDDDEEEEKEEGNGLLIPILIGSLIVVVVAAVVLVVVLVGRKNKKSAATPTAPSPDFGTSSQGVPGQFWLAARGGRMDGRVYPVDNREITIGRDVSSTICYPADTPGVSRVHAKLYREGARLMLMDCSSTAGTFLNRIGRLEPMRPVEVYAGDVFYVGEASNSFEIKS